jgi:acetyl-CoA carboxylase beta subunit
MSLRPPSAGASAAEAAFDALGHEILAEKAAALGRAGQRVEETLTKLRQNNDDKEQRSRLLKEAAVAVHAYFIQRELCGLRRHESVIREYDIPRAVLVRLGAS